VVATTEVFEADDILVACAAFPPTDATLNDWLSKTAYAYRNYAKKLLLGHFQVVGCSLNSGTAVTGIDAAMVRKYDLCLLGHVHKPQHIGNAYYVGSPFQQNFGEKGEAKRVGVFDFDKFEVTWIPMEGFPEYRVVTYKQWAAMVKKQEEHRYQVRLSSPKEAESFYAHPLMSYAAPVYEYELASKAKDEAAQRQTWTKDDVMRRYVASRPPKSRGIQTPDDDVLFLGDVIAKSE